MLDDNKNNVAFNKEYLKIWQKTFSKNYQKEPFDLDSLIEKHRGSFMDRLLRKSSSQYNAFITTFKEFNDPNSPNYLNNDLLREKGEAYLDYRSEKGISFSKLDQNGREKLKFISATIKTIDEVEAYKKDITEQINNSLKRESFLEPDEVEENINGNQIDDDLSNDMILEKSNLTLQTK